MGIPHLISTLEPFAVHGLLENQSVVIDGPALAYHVLHVCNRNGVALPSYQLLGDVAVAWLDELSCRRVNVEAIYFDGHLPLAKRPTRMERMAKSFGQLQLAYAADTKGRARTNFSSAADKFTTSELFSVKPMLGRPFLPPSFHVPAVIDALKLSPQYQSRVCLVPGEADAFCAQHLLKSGGTVLTSDSDLLAHGLGQGRVIFFRDVYLDGDSRLACASFSPSIICERLALQSSDQICRFAYERRQDPNLSISQIVQECSKPVDDVTLYEEFCKEYLHHEVAVLPLHSSGRSLQISWLDPRISELVLQFGQSNNADDITQESIFLPILIEDPSRGSAWEQTTTLRQLAYTVLRQIIPCRTSSVYEYRRVNNATQKGRKLDLMHKALADGFSEGLVNLMAEIEKTVRDNLELSWLLFCLIIDVRYCSENGQQSHMLQILQRAPQITNSNKISWGVIHFVARLHAAYYSLRILYQILCLVPAQEVAPSLHGLLASLPSLPKLPDMGRVIELLLEPQDAQIMAIVAKIVPLPEHSEQVPPAATWSKKSKHSREGRVTKKKKNSLGGNSHVSRNPFDLLLQKDDE
ncbi:XPG domain containing-domain-containing protein [Mariannaea sp. PMI_226]|nr:XPG domain containing-domain-containing protein [Mariannaea sp. PMI_226]